MMVINEILIEFHQIWWYQYLLAVQKQEWKNTSEETMLYDFLGQKHSTRLKYRTSRAVYLLMMCVQSSPKKYDSTYGYYGNNFDSIFCAEVESDTDGAMVELPRKYVRCKYPI